MFNCRCEASLITTKETCEINTSLQTQRRSSARISHIGTTHPADSDTTRWDRHPWSLHCSIRTLKQADTAHGFCFQATLWYTRQQSSLQCPPFEAPVSHPLELLATRVPSDQRALAVTTALRVVNGALTVCRDSDTAAVPKIHQLALDPQRSRARRGGCEQLAFPA